MSCQVHCAFACAVLTVPERTRPSKSLALADLLQTFTASQMRRWKNQLMTKTGKPLPRQQAQPCRLS